MGSTGEKLIIETTALAVMGWLNFDEFKNNTDLGIKYLISQNKDGLYGSSQSTILTLKAIVKYEEKNKIFNGNG